MKFEKVLSGLIFFLFLCPTLLFSQSNDSIKILFTGIVITADSLKPIPFVNIKIEGTSQNALTDNKGFFSFKTYKNKNIIFSCLGYKTAYFKIPDTVKHDHYFFIQGMMQDTLHLNETLILPWANYMDFQKAIITTDINNDEMKRARKNIKQIQDISLTANLPLDAEANYKNFVAKMWTTARTKGQMTLLINFAF